MKKRFLSPGEKIENFSTWALLKSINQKIKPYRGKFLLGSFLRLTADISNLYPTYALASLITILSKGNVAQSANKIWTIAILWIISAIYRVICKYFSKKILFRISQKTALDVEQESISHMFNLDMAWHEKENTGNKLQRIKNASNGYRMLMNIWINNLIEIIINFIGGLVILFNFNKPIALATGIFLICYLTLSKIIREKAAIAYNEVNIQGEELTGLQYEAVANIRSIKIMSMVKTMKDLLNLRTNSVFEAIKKNVFWTQFRSLVEQALALIFKFGILIFVVYGIIKGRYEAGLLILFNNYFNNVWMSVDELSNVSQDILVSRYSISRLNKIMDEKVTIDDEKGKRPFPTDWKTIQLKNVNFSYENNLVLKNISFVINRGEKIGIIGLSGAGKSTIFKLLLKEYENFDGEILIDNVPIREISKKKYFESTAAVLQETEVFNFSLRENIFFAGPGTKNKESELQKALEIAHVTDFLPKLQNGVDTEIGEKGVRLSGGEKQRLGIARAVFKNPQLLLLDEATSHLDLESEEKIQDSLHKFFKNVTAVVIAHRLTTIKEMDKIIVIENGEVIESGNFAELTAKRGRFFELWEKQRL